MVRSHEDSSLNSAPSRLSPSRELFKRLLRLYLRYMPIRSGKKFIMKSLSPLIVGKGYREIASLSSGIRMKLDLDDWIQCQVYFFGYYFMEMEEARVLFSLLSPGDIFMDIGANVGVYTLQAAVRVGPSGHVHAFEPITKNFNRLKENVELNQLGNITLNRIAVSDSPGPLRLYVADPSNTGTSSISKMENWSGVCEEVETITIDEYIGKSSIKSVRLVKIDVEGCELKVVHGMRHLLSSEHPPDLAIEIESEHLEAAGTSTKELTTFLSKLGYNPFLITKSGLRTVDFVPNAHLVLFRYCSVVGPS